MKQLTEYFGGLNQALWRWLYSDLPLSHVNGGIEISLPEARV
jgi:hypothetical protein